MSATTPKSAFRTGVMDGLPFLLVLTPFGILFGVTATEAGLNVLETMMFTIVVIAGASQFSALQLMTDNAPTLIVLATALAVNLRMAMYSASLTPYLGQASLWQRALISYFLVDATYACAIGRFELHPEWQLPARLGYFFGTVVTVCPAWYALTLIGALIGSAIPGWLALDFAVPICFLAMVAPMLRTVAHLAAALTSVILALSLAFIPYSLGLLIAAIVAMMVGAFVETRTQ
jgi:predicted branched-subunit amino acid permease